VAEDAADPEVMRVGCWLSVPGPQHDSVWRCHKADGAWARRTLHAAYTNGPQATDWLPPCTSQVAEPPVGLEPTLGGLKYAELKLVEPAPAVPRI